jgi:hypothetical protein
MSDNGDTTTDVRSVRQSRTVLFKLSLTYQVVVGSFLVAGGWGLLLLYAVPVSTYVGGGPFGYIVLLAATSVPTAIGCHVLTGMPAGHTAFFCVAVALCIPLTEALRAAGVGPETETAPVAATTSTDSFIASLPKGLGVCVPEPKLMKRSLEVARCNPNGGAATALVARMASPAVANQELRSIAERWSRTYEVWRGNWRSYSGDNAGRFKFIRTAGGVHKAWTVHDRALVVHAWRRDGGVKRLSAWFYGLKVAP